MATWNLTRLSPLTPRNHGWCKKPCLWRQWSSWRNHNFPIPYTVMVEMAYSSSVYEYTSSQFLAPWHLANIRPSKSWKLNWPLPRSRKYPGYWWSCTLLYQLANMFFSCFMSASYPPEIHSCEFPPFVVPRNHRSVAIQVTLHHLKKHQVISSPFFGDTLDLPHTQ